MASKTKSGSTEITTPSSKSSMASPRVSRLNRGLAKSEPSSPSPVQSSRIVRSPQSVNSKPTAERRSPKVPTPPEKTRSTLAKGSETQTRLNQIQEDLKKAKEQIALLEKDKAKALEELKDAQQVAEDASKKLTEALVAQKMAKENLEIEKFQAVEAGIEVAQKNEEEWKKEVESVKNQHSLDVAALLSAKQELENAKLELAVTKDAKNKAVTEADDATKMVEIHAEKVEILSSELFRLKALLDSTREKETISENEMVSKLSSEIGVLKQELAKAKNLEADLKERNAYVVQLNVDLEAARMAESYARSLAEEWQNKVGELEKQLEEANKLERSASESLQSVMKQLEGSNDSLHDAESEIAGLKEKVGLLEMTTKRQKRDLEESESRVGSEKDELLRMTKLVDSLKNELETVKDEKTQALKNEKLAASSVQQLLEEKNKTINELESSREEEEKCKKAMESLASALHEVSAEARELKEKLLNHGDNEQYETQIDDLKMVVKATSEKYEHMLDEAKHEIDVLLSAVEQTKNHFESSKIEWGDKEANLMNRVKNSEEEIHSLEKEITRLVNLLRRNDEEANLVKQEETQLKDSLKEAEDEAINLQKALGEAKAESLKLKEKLLDKETEFQSVIQEMEDLRAKEATSLKKIEELSKLLEDAVATKHTEENSEITDSEKDYDVLPKVVEFSIENGHRSEEEKSKTENLKESSKGENENEFKNEKEEEEGKPIKDDESKEKADETVEVEFKMWEEEEGKPIKDDESKEKADETVEVEFKMWESCQIEKKEAFLDKKPEQETLDEEEDPKIIEESDKISKENVEDEGILLTKEQQIKKKKTLLGKMGNLLKKKGSSGHQK